jgi:hypothetical protein
MNWLNAFSLALKIAAVWSQVAALQSGESGALPVIRTRFGWTTWEIGPITVTRIG